ncbi:MAG: YihY/virulence factor BrkB family protein [Acetobacteraceae bacterium]
MTEHLIPEAPPEIPLPREDAAGPGAEAQRLLQAPDAIALGRMADSPGQIPWRGWRAVIRRTFFEMLTDRVSLVAAGCAFYGTLALFPAISMLISIYGLVFDPLTVEPQLALLRDLLPPSGYQLIAERVHMLVSKPPGSLGISLVLSTAVALWSSASGVKSIITALNLAYEESEQRNFVRYQLTTIAITLIAILSAVVGLAVLVGLPAILAFIGIPAGQKTAVQLASLALLLLGIMIGLSLLYRYGPCRKSPKWHWVTPGSLLATVLWISASALFSWYVERFATYDATYGPLGTVVGVMMWFYVTVYAVLLGAELNAELELQTVRDSTDGPPKPLGRRGAYVADHVAEE